MKLEDCPIRHGFRLRGHAMTRTETFTDAAFAFAVTMLVISIDAVPKSFDEMILAVKGVPAFLLSFALMMMFWSGHWRWSRRFGLEDAPSVTLSLFLVFCVLVYVYLLKYHMTLFMYWISGGVMSPDAKLSGPDQLYMVFVVYGCSWVALSGAILLLNLYAWRKRSELELSTLEQVETRTEIQSWWILLGVGVLSVLLALFTPPFPGAPPAWAYAALAIVMPVHAILRERVRKRIEGQ